MEHDVSSTLFLPIAIVSPVDVGRVTRELGALDEYFNQANLRGDTDEKQLPRITAMLEDLIKLNKINPLSAPERSRLISFLESVKQEAPLLHMSFSAPSTPRFTHHLIAYIREELHPLALLRTGLLPTIGAGCVLRTNNKVFDFSLRQHFIAQKQVLITRLATDPIPEQQPSQTPVSEATNE